MTDKFFLGIFFVILLLLGGFALYERTEVERLESQIAELRYEIDQLRKQDRINAQDIDFMMRLISGKAFKELEDK